MSHAPRLHEYLVFTGLEEDGQYLQVSSIGFQVGKPWTGQGKIVLSCLFWPEFINFLKRPDKADLKILVGQDKSQVILVMGLDVSNADIKFEELEYSRTDFMRITATISYERMDVVSNPTIIDSIVAVT